MWHGYEASDKVFLPYTYNTTTKDFILGTKSEQSVAVSKYGNPLSELDRKYSNFETVIPFYTVSKTIADYKNDGKWNESSPATIKSFQKLENYPEFAKTINL